MKYYFVSKYRFVYMLALTVVILVGAMIIIPVGWKAVVKEKMIVGGLFLILLSLIAASGMVTEFISAATTRYRFSKEGIIYTTPFKKKIFYWNELKCCGTIVSAYDIRGEYCLYVYFTENFVTDEEVLKLSSANIRKRNDIFFFLYNEGAFQELMKFIPPQWQDKLRRECVARVEQMEPVTRLRYRMYK